MVNREIGTRRSTLSVALGVAAVAVGAAVLLPASAQSTYPGQNGRIAYTSGSDDAAEVTTILPNGTGVQTLTANSVEEHEPRWTADGGTLSFVRDDGDSDLFTIPAAGGASDQITTDPSNEDDGDFSPNGNKFVFESDRSGPDQDEVYSMNADGSNVKRLTKKGDNDNPAYSPSGQKIVFGSDRDGDEEIFVMKANGDDEKQLTKNGAEDDEPEWSPNGKKIVFESDRAGGDDEIVRMQASGKKQKLLTDGSDDDLDPDFSPDGELIVFQSDRDGDNDIWTMNLNGGALFNVTNNVAISDDSPDWGVD